MKFLALTARFLALAAMAGGAWTLPATAAPFCITDQVLAPQCIYYDAQNCQRDAQRQNAACTTNPAEFTVTPGVGQYCVITSSQISTCAYADRGTCAQEAAREHGTCIDAPQLAPAGTPDPYSPINGN